VTRRARAGKAQNPTFNEELTVDSKETLGEMHVNLHSMYVCVCFPLYNTREIKAECHARGRINNRAKLSDRATRVEPCAVSFFANRG
jgi:hypothetical protein